MQRSAGVTANVIVALLGSLITLAMGILMALALVAAPTPPPEPNFPDFPASPEFFRAIRIVVPLFYLLPAAWGITTSVGLFRLRNWARISIIVFAALLTLWGLFGMLMALVMFAMPAPTMPPGMRLDPNVFLVVMRLFFMVFAAVQLGLGIWWLVFFNLAKVREQFVPQAVAFTRAPVMPTTAPPPSIYPATPSQAIPSAPGPAAPSLLNMPGRPASITVVAILLLAGSLFAPLSLVLGSPAVLLVKIITGWPAMVYFSAVFVLQLYIAIGLLRLQPVARWIGIAYFVFAFVNTGVFFLAPGARARITGLLVTQLSIFPWMRSLPAFPLELMTPIMIVAGGVGVLSVLVQLCFLVINRRAFAKSAVTA